MTPTCPTHNRPLICPCCVGARGGAKGGTATSPRKARAARRNGRKGGRPAGENRPLTADEARRMFEAIDEARANREWRERKP